MQSSQQIVLQDLNPQQNDYSFQELVNPYQRDKDIYLSTCQKIKEQVKDISEDALWVSLMVAVKLVDEKEVENICRFIRQEKLKIIINITDNMNLNPLDYAIFIKNPNIVENLFAIGFMPRKDWENLLRVDISNFRSDYSDYNEYLEKQYVAIILEIYYTNLNKNYENTLKSLKENFSDKDLKVNFLKNLDLLIRSNSKFALSFENNSKENILNVKVHFYRKVKVTLGGPIGGNVNFSIIPPYCLQIDNSDITYPTQTSCTVLDLKKFIALNSNTEAENFKVSVEGVPVQDNMLLENLLKNHKYLKHIVTIYKGQKIIDVPELNLYSMMPKEVKGDLSNFLREKLNILLNEIDQLTHLSTLIICNIKSYILSTIIAQTEKIINGEITVDDFKMEGIDEDYLFVVKNSINNLLKDFSCEEILKLNVISKALLKPMDKMSDGLKVELKDQIIDVMMRMAREEKSIISSTINNIRIEINKNRKIFLLLAKDILSQQDYWEKKASNYINLFKILNGQDINNLSPTEMESIENLLVTEAEKIRKIKPFVSFILFKIEYNRNDEPAFLYQALAEKNIDQLKNIQIQINNFNLTKITKNNKITKNKKQFT